MYSYWMPCRYLLSLSQVVFSFTRMTIFWIWREEINIFIFFLILQKLLTNLSIFVKYPTLIYHDEFSLYNNSIIIIFNRCTIKAFSDWQGAAKHSSRSPYDALVTTSRKLSIQKLNLPKMGLDYVVEGGTGMSPRVYIYI